MSAKSDFTPEAWLQLLQAPIIAGMAITFASPAIGDAVKESMAVAKTLADATLQTGQEDDLYAEFVAAYKDKETFKQAQPKFERTDIDRMIAKAVDDVAHTATMLDATADAAEAAKIKQLIYAAALATAEAAKEGDFMGIGGVRVNEAEKAVLDRLAAALNITPA